MIGIDPGLKGAIAFYYPGDPGLYVWDMPTVEQGGAREVNGRELARLLGAIPAYEPAVVEEVGAMPTDGRGSAFAFGMGYGKILGILEAQRRLIYRLPPSVWKGALGLTSNKTDSLDLARRTFSVHHQHYFARRKDDGRAEAALLAKLGHERFGTFAQPTKEKVR